MSDATIDIILQKLDEMEKMFNNRTASDRIFLNKEQAAELLNISVRTLERLGTAGTLKPRKVGSRSLYHIDDLNNFANNCPYDYETVLKNKGVKFSILK